MFDRIPVHERVTEQDLSWWFQTAAELTWTNARSYARYAPHRYVALRHGRMSEQDFVRAARVIRTFGEPGRYRSYTNIYLESPDGHSKWWIMDRPHECDLINQADANLWYGTQDAPSTYLPGCTQYDSIATVYDTYRDREFDGKIRRRILECFGDYSPTVLDVGCGTGALLELRRTVKEQVLDPARYTGVDASQGMLNQLVLKFPSVHRIIPGSFDDVTELEPQYDLVAAVEVPGVDLDRCRQLARKLLVVRAAPSDG